MIALPTNRDENWRYANLRPLAKAKADAPPPVSHADVADAAALDGFQRWTFVDARHAGNTATAREVASRLDARAAGEAFTGMLDTEIAAAGVDFALARFNARHGDEVLHIAVPEDTAASLEVVFIASASAAAGTSYPRLQVQLGRNAKLQLVERHESAGAHDSAVNAAVDISVGHGACLTHVRLQDCAEQASVFDTLVAHVGENAQYRLRSITLGGISSRSTAFVRLAGRAARCDFVAASVANGTQTHDFFAEIDHAAPAAATREIFRGIASGRGKLAFNGKMIVRENAHDADSDQSLKTLLNGTGAEAAARPQLEIYTDRVKARHGATTGKLDEQMLFYLLSRGIDRPQAQALLQWAFVEDAISQIELAPLRQCIERLVAARLNEVASLDGLVSRP
jgi:Fe-S cluster assembly protein SufD